ncbi:HAMP domain-containing sensor histidine kinase [Paenibacillus sp. 19GGS1-52]|uniref:HAMP domain-containing sensor histidine kinase n=1 Tax=Paenibacillus sp. 19GGS1-52 TaxID=2758563 RepID=UPI001EFBE211|nr:HAMP domain-containing histidine kinase [Paenibacillus sp. 19GGS1-52]ULO04688.1 HAMP domain-containing sensor histidine kinase [Paenibacillus sp. 19GGS1-52]
MTRLRVIFSRLSIRWKLAIWSSLLLCVLFLAYNGIQYFVINQWMFHQEEKAIQKNMEEIQGYFTAENGNAEEIMNSHAFINSINESHQMIRILDQQGIPILTVSEMMPEDWVKPEVSIRTTMRSSWHEEEHLLIIRSPLQTSQFTGTIEIVNNLENSDQLSNMLLAVMLAGWLGAIVISGLGGIFLSRQLLRPIQSLTDTMTNIKQKGLQERVEISNSNDELAHLSIVFNELMDQLERSFHNQKQFVEDASHELRTPISIIEGHISLLNRWGKHDPDILEESLNVSVQELGRLKGIVNELLELTRAEADPSSGYHFSAVIRDTIEYTLKNFVMLHTDFGFHQDLEPLEQAKININPNHLEQILLILLDNAIKYSAQIKEISVEGSLKHQRVYIKVTDQGIGIPQEDVPYVFQRFYRVDKSRSREQGGTGLGLAIAERLVARYDGEISITSISGRGTIVTLSFPLSR